MLSIHESSYIIEPYRIESHGSRKADGELPVINIGKKCSIAANITFVLSNHLMNRFTTHPSPVNLFPHGKGATTSYSKGDIIIKNDVWIGTNVTLIDGITIGNGAVIAAGSVVVKDVPPYAIVGGNPAKILKYRFTPEIIHEIEKTGFWELPMADINKFNIHTDDIEALIKDIKHFKNMSYVNFMYKLEF